MGPKKNNKDIQPQKQAKHSSVMSNKQRTVKTTDGGIFHINDAVLSKFSGKLRRKIQDFKGDEVLQIDEADKITFKYIEQFLSSPKDKQISQIHFPIRSNISLKYIMDESDALLMQKIDKQGGMQLVARLLDAATALQIQDMRKRLFCLVAFNLSRSTVDQLKEMYEIPDIETNQDSVKSQMKIHLENLKKKLVEQ